MKNKTDAMNSGLSSEDALNGFGNAGKPVSRKAYKTDQMKGAALYGNEALTKAENPMGDDEKSHIGGFLPRNNYSDRY